MASSRKSYLKTPMCVRKTMGVRASLLLYNPEKEPPSSSKRSSPKLPMISKRMSDSPRSDKSTDESLSTTSDPIAFVRHRDIPAPSYTILIGYPIRRLMDVPRTS
ncbi:hypothetical protein OUZ56_011295 [Daphnia magna]|uniref:Uncharacterized protein n=1 Tax=Daphnia magna TaxID=35525 RepID=A0ABQ9YZW6_9CRUS|nr:hypothetical protein OUZ56_011295 [Daphnia magna]